MKAEKQVVLFAASVLLASAFFLLPCYSKWMSVRVLPYWTDFQAQKDDLSIETRRATRYGPYYTNTKLIAKNLQKVHPRLLLLPSTAYFKSKGIDYPVPEPAVFYYFTGMRTTWPNSPLAQQARWVVRAEHGKFQVDSVTADYHLADTIAAFLKYPVTL